MEPLKEFGIWLAAAALAANAGTLAHNTTTTTTAVDDGREQPAPAAPVAKIAFPSQETTRPPDLDRWR